jgi:hypothetical protein
MNIIVAVSKTIGSSFFCPHGCPVPFESIRGLSTHLHNQHKSIKQPSAMTTTTVLSKVEQQKHLAQQQLSSGRITEQPSKKLSVGATKAEQKHVEVKGTPLVFF